MLKYQGAEMKVSGNGYPSSNCATPKATHSINLRTPCKSVCPTPLTAINFLNLTSTNCPYVGDVGCCARRRAWHDEDDEDKNEEGYGYNAEIGALELYSQSASDEVLLVKAIVDDREEEVLIFKGFSSSLTYGTSPDPSKSILPARAVIKSIDRIRSPFNPSNVEYIEKGLTWEVFRSRLPNQF